MSLGGQTFVVQHAKEIGLADGVAFRLQLRVNLRQGVALATQFAGAVADGVAFGGGPVHARGGAEELVEVGVLREVAHQSADRAGPQLKALGDLVGREALQEVGPANLVVPLGGGLGVLEQAGEFLGACHGSWGWLRQVGRS